jgi:hypothetical protein
MRNLILRLLLLCLIATGTTTLFAQTSPFGYAKAVDELLQNVDKSGITTGLLYDRAYPKARLDVFNQLGTPDTTSPSHFEQAYYELFQASYNNAPFPITVDSLDGKIRWHNFYKQIPIGIIDCHMQQINPDAYTNGWLNIDHDEVQNIPGQTLDIYQTKHPQIASPMFAKPQAGIYDLVLDSWMLFSNTGWSITGIYVTINGVTNYLPLGGKLPITLNEGDNFLRLEVHFTNGNSFSNTVLINTESKGSFAARTAGASAPPCAEMEVKAQIPYKGYNENRFIKGKNTLSFYYADCNNPVLRKPVIILDGLDPEDKRNGQIIYNEWFNYYNSYGSSINLAERLRVQGNDVVIVNMPEFIDDDCPTCPPIMGGSDYIQRNAMVLVEIINKLNTQLATNGSNEKLVIVGPSMGGQISRYALTYMEQHGMTHNCRLWISFDSPHLGADLPIGIQHYINEMADMGSKYAKNSKRINLEVPATREQLLDHTLAHADINDIVTRPDPMFFAYYNEQNTQGIADPNNGNLVGWPVNCRKISMISGALNGHNQAEGYPAARAVHSETKLSWKAVALIGGGGGLLFFNNPINPFSWLVAGAASTIKLAKGDIYVSPAKNQTSEVTYAKYLFKNRVWYSTNNYPLVQTGSIDWLPGGNRAFFREIKESTKDEWYTSTNVDVDVNYSNFIPTASSLALGKGKDPNPNRKWDDDLRGINLACPYAKETPFDFYFGPGIYSQMQPEVNLKHDSLFEAQANIVLEEISGITHHNKNLVGSAFSYSGGVWCPGTTRTFTSNVLNYPFAWSINSSNFTIISGQNSPQITVLYNGGQTTPIGIGMYYDDGCAIYSTDQAVDIEFGDLNFTTASYTNGDQDNDIEFNLVNQVSDYTTRVLINIPGLIQSSIVFSHISSTGTLYGWGQQTFHNLQSLWVAAPSECDYRNRVHNFKVDFQTVCTNGQTETRYFTLHFCNRRNERIFFSQNYSGGILSVNIIDKSENQRKKEFTEAKLYDLSGRLLAFTKNNTSNRFQIVIPNLKQGIYLANLITKDGKTEVLKIFIDR